MKYRAFRVNGQVTDWVFSTDGDEFGVPAAQHVAALAEALNVSPANIDVFETEDDPSVAVAVHVPPQAEEVTLPDPGQLLLAIFGTFGKPAARTLAAAYPDFQDALHRRNWAIARAAVDDALADGAVTQEQYDTIQGFFTQFGIPEA